MTADAPHRSSATVDFEEFSTTRRAALAHLPPPIDINDIKSVGVGQECFAIDAGKRAPGGALEQNSNCVAPNEITLAAAGQQVASFKVKQRSVDNCKNCHRATYQVVGAAFANITITFNGRINAKTAIERGTVRICNVSRLKRQSALQPTGHTCAG